MFNIFLKRDWKNNNYKGGTLLIPQHAARKLLSGFGDDNLQVPINFFPPKKIDNRDLCIASSDQGNTPMCAAYTCSDCIEMYNWKIKGYPEHVNPVPIYHEAKTKDGSPGSDGTTLDAVCAAAIELKLIDGKAKFFAKDVSAIKYAIHRYGSCMLGFMITNEWNTTNTKTGRLIQIEDSKIYTLGGHAVYGCGYDEEGLYIQNSWGTDWALHGFALLTWRQVLNQFLYGAVIVPSLM